MQSIRAGKFSVTTEKLDPGEKIMLVFFVKFLDVLSTFEPSDIAGELEMSEI